MVLPIILQITVESSREESITINRQISTRQQKQKDFVIDGRQLFQAKITTSWIKRARASRAKSEPVFQFPREFSSV